MLSAFRYFCGCCVGLMTACSIGSLPATAAEITFRESFNSVDFEGRIVSGDYEKLRSIAFDIDGLFRIRPDQNFQIVLHLFSPGGDLAEAIKIGRLVRALRWMTNPPEKLSELEQKKHFAMRLKDPETNFMCASACFMIFVAGVERGVGYRSHAGKPILGIHRPYLSEAELKSMSGKDAMTSSTNTRAVVERYFKEMSVPAKYADMVFSIPKDQILWLNPNDVQVDLAGFIPELKDWVDAKCDSRTDIEKTLSRTLEAKLNNYEAFSREEESLQDMLNDKDMKRSDCERAVEVDLDKQGFKEVFFGK